MCLTVGIKFHLVVSFKVQGGTGYNPSGFGGGGDPTSPPLSGKVLSHKTINLTIYVTIFPVI